MNTQLSGYSHYIETDYNRYDRTISAEYLEQVQDPLLTAAFPRDLHPLLHACLDLAHETSGRSEYGVAYKVAGTRCSGDAHTSYANGLINHFNTWLCLRSLPADSWTSVHEGDDGVIAVRDGMINQAVANLDLLTTLGFGVKMDVYINIDDVSFCGRHLYQEGGEIGEHADILRTLSKYHTTISNLKDITLAYAKACSYYYTDAHTPLLGPLSYAIMAVLHNKLSFSQRKRAHRVSSKRYIMRDHIIPVFDKVPKFAPSAITVEARVSCMRRTGLTIPIQVALEKAYLRQVTCGSIFHLPKINAEWFSREDGFVSGDPADFVR